MEMETQCTKTYGVLKKKDSSKKEVYSEKHSLRKKWEKYGGMRELSLFFCLKLQ